MLTWLLTPAGNLVVLVVGLVWLAIVGLKPHEPAPVPSPEDARLVQTRRLLREAAERLRAIPKTKPKDFEQATKQAWPYMHASGFVERAFLHHIKPEFDRYIAGERKRYEEADQKFSLTDTAADYLEQLAARITTDDVDYGFTLPSDYDHFEKTSEWPPNKRPIVKPHVWPVE